MVSARLFRFALTWYPPFWGTGVRVEHVAKDFREIRVAMPLRFYNRNYVATHFGGSLYAMTDPFYMLMLMQILGNQYHVWDKSGHIDYLKPGKTKVSATFVISEQSVREILDATSNGEKYLPSFEVPVVDTQGETVALVTKQLYIRKKPRFREPN